MKYNFINQYYASMIDIKVRANIQQIVDDNGYDYSIKNLLTNTYDYMINKPLPGGCHALSSVLYIALSELGYNPTLCIGECGGKEIKPFDHSWVTVNNKVVDLAVYLPLDPSKKGILSGPVIFNIDGLSMKEHKLQYGINTGLPFNEPTENVIKSSFVNYMNNFSCETNGLWTVLDYICPSIKYSEELVDRYSNTERVLVR